MSAVTSEVTTTEIVKADALAPAFVGLEASSARQLREAFVPALLQIEEWERQASELTVTDESQTAKMEMAAVMRKALKKVRVGVEKKRKDLNADALARTKAINCAAGIVEGLIVPLEKRLLEQETFGERAAEARRNQLREARSEAIRAYGHDASTLADLGLMGDDAWAATIESIRLAHEARLEETRRAEAIRIEATRLEAEAREKARVEAVRLEAERVERERVQAEENARLRREAAEREAALQVERARVEAERAAVEARARAERDAAAAETRRAREAAEAAERALAAERSAVARREAEAFAAAARKEEERSAAEAKRIADEAAAHEAALLAPDREKLAAFAASIRSLVIPSLTTPKGRAAAAKVASQLEKMAAWVAATGEDL